jgi:hypothetical protein
VNATNSEAPAVRSIHLQGGGRANDVGGLLQLELLASNGRHAELIPPSFHHAYGALRRAGFLVVGADFFFEIEQADGRRLPSWRAHHSFRGTSWPCAEQADKWSFIAHSAIRQKNGLLWDVATRVSHQLRACDWRLRQVSEAYRDQLHAKVRAEEFADGKRFFDGFTWLGYLAIQAFLVDACVLRDYLAEYRALVLSQSGEKVFTSKITRIASLKKQYLSRGQLAASVDQQLQQATEAGGWLRLLGGYRDLVVHYAPIASAGQDLYALCIRIPLDAQITVPSIKLPIPPDPDKISAERTSGAHVDDPEQNYARFLNAIKDPGSALDGLGYAHSVLGHLSVLASGLAALSPVKPEMPVLTDEDIFDIKIVESGAEKND